MGLFSSPFVRETYLPATPAETFAGIQTFLRRSTWTLDSADDFTLAVTFRTGMTAMTWGMVGSAQVIPNGDGSTLSVTVTPKMGGAARNAANQQRIADELFAGVSTQIRATRSAQP